MKGIEDTDQITENYKWQINTDTRTKTFNVIGYFVCNIYKVLPK